MKLTSEWVKPWSIIRRTAVGRISVVTAASSRKVSAPPANAL